MMDSSHQSSVTSSPTSFSSGERERDRNHSGGSNSTVATSNASIKLGGNANTKAWGSLPSRKLPGLAGLNNGAIGSERGTSNISPSVSTYSAAKPGGEWYPPLSKAELLPNQPAFPTTHSGIASIGSGRRNVSEANSARSSRPTSPSFSFSAHQSPVDSNTVSLLQSPETSVTAIASAGLFPNENAACAPMLSAGSGVTSTPSELESAFDAMLRGSMLFQNLERRVNTLESHIENLLPKTSLVNGHGLLDVTPTHSPSLATSNGINSYLMPSANGARPNNLHVANSAPSSSVASTPLQSPLSPANEPVPYPSDYEDAIRHLTVQLSAIGINVAHLMAQQVSQTSVTSTNLGATLSSTPGVGSWPFDGPQHTPPHALHGHGPPHSAPGRPNLSNFRSSSFDVSRGGVLPRSAAVAAAVSYAEERDARRRSRMTLQAPTPIGMGSRRHSADVVDNMHAPADGILGPGMNGSGGIGNQSLLGKWETLGISGELLRAIVKYGIGPPSKIQMKAIPCILSMQDVVAQASSIQERIQCYVIPTLQYVYSNMSQAALSSLNQHSLSEAPSPTSKGVQALILTATIDQAGQAHRMCLGLGQTLGISSSLVVGHGDVSSDLAAISATPPHVLVGTPQKILDLLSIRAVPVEKLSLLVIDEMDQLIARNLSDYVNNVARLLPPPISNGTGNRERSPALSSHPFKPFEPSTSPTGGVQERQTAIFSCTVPQEVLNFASALNLREPVRVLVRRENNQENATVQTPSLRGMKHFYFYSGMGNNIPGSRAPGAGRQDQSSGNRDGRLEVLGDFCAAAEFTQAVVYCSSTEAIEAVSYKLASRNIDALVLHGDMGASARHTAITKFRSGVRGAGLKRVLVVYDALSRTLTDIHQVSLVINFDMPRTVEDYVNHAICAASSGYVRAGASVNIVSSPSDIEMLRAIESFYRLKINELPPALSYLASPSER